MIQPHNEILQAPAIQKGLLVYLERLWWDHFPQSLNPVFFRDVNPPRYRPEEDGIGRTRIAGLRSHFETVDQRKIGELARNLLCQALRVLLLAAQHRWGRDAQVVCNDTCPFFQQGERTAGFQQLKSEQDVPFPFRDYRRKNFPSVAYVGDDTASPLGHAVDLALFHVKTGQHEGFGKDLRGQQDSLSAHTDEEDVGYGSAHFFLPIASALHNWRQTSQPVQSW